MRRRLLGLAVSASLAVSVVTLARAGASGLVQVSGRTGCHAPAADRACTPALGVAAATTLAVSGDGRNVYVGAGIGSLGRLAVFARSPVTGLLTQLGGKNGCFQVYRGSARCSAARALETPRTIVVSPDGANVYVTAQSNSAVAVFSRLAGGALRQLAGQDACVSQASARCLPARSLGQPGGLAVSPDGAHVYAGSNSGIAIFGRIRPSGRLVQLVGAEGCVNQRGGTGCDRAAGSFQGGLGLAVSPDGRNVYAVSGAGTLHTFTRDARGRLRQDACLSDRGRDPGCPAARSLAGGASIAISPDGRNVYVAARSSSGIAALARDPESGALTQLPGTDGCATATGSRGKCARGTALAEAVSVAVSGNGRWVYVASAGRQRGGIAVFARDRTTGALAQAGCIAASPAGGCTRGRALVGTRSVAASPEGRNAYSAAAGPGGAATHSPGGGVGVFRAR